MPGPTCAPSTPPSWTHRTASPSRDGTNWSPRVSVSRAAIASAAGWPSLVSPNAVLVAVLFSGLVGIFFGFYPAQRAARYEELYG